MPSSYSAYWLGKLKLKIEHSGGIAQRRPRLDMGCNAIAAAVICSAKYADDLVLLAKEQTVLKCKTDRLTEVGRYYGMEMNMEKTTVTRISRQPSPVQIMTDQKQLGNV
jgi:hypothetical protein